MQITAVLTTTVQQPLPSGSRIPTLLLILLITVCSGNEPVQAGPGEPAAASPVGELAPPITQPAASRTPASLSGEQAFAACAACHSLTDGAAHKLGPNLHGVVGAKAGRHEDFAYSPALRNSGLTWTRENLMVWIADSETMLPGSWMLYHNFLTAAEIVALIDYLQQAGV